MRGEQSIYLLIAFPPSGSPPLARGTAVGVCGQSAITGITPACAGNRDFFDELDAEFGDHPRLRGEQVRENKGKAVNAGSPPLARGTELYSQ